MRFAFPSTHCDAVPRWPFGVPAMDAVLDGGLAFGSVHEIYAAENEDGAAAAGFAVNVATGMAATGGAVLWLRPQWAARPAMVAQAHGWVELGGRPEQALLGLMPDAISLLRATVDALRCPGIGAVIMETWGTMRQLDLTASRRLALAAEKSGVPLLLLHLNQPPTPSAARTRWQVSSAPSQALPGNAPGRPCFNVTLLRQRSGPCGFDWRLEWDRDRHQFHNAPLSGAVVPLPADRQAADRTDSGARQAA